MKTIGFIGAKKKSLRLPDKNIKVFCGLPLFAWSVIQSQSSIYVDETYVSTDSELIAEMATKQFGAQIIWRDYEQNPDEPITVPLKHTVEKLDLQPEDEIVNLLVTSPIRYPYDIDNMIEAKRKLGLSEIAPMLGQEEAIFYTKVNDHVAKLKIWDKTGAFLIAGVGWSVMTIKWLTNNWLLEEPQTAIDQKPYANYCSTIKFWQRYDIDYIEEFEFCELLMEHYILKGRGVEIYEQYREKKEIEVSKLIDLVPDIQET
jgi:N-acylneuraminate cytidylyltransferase